MPVDRHTIRIERPLAHVFRLLSDPARQRGWIGGLVEVLPLGDVPQGKGARYRWTLEIGGRYREMEAEVTLSEPPFRHALSFSADGFRCTMDWRLVERDGGTDLSVTAAVRDPGLIGAVMGSAVGREQRRKTAADLERLKAAAEGQRALVDPWRAPAPRV